MLKASQKRTKRAALTEALMSSAPAITFGWLATTPTGCPSRRAKPTTMFIAKYCWTSKKSPLSTTIRTTSLMSYDSFDESGMIVARPGSARSGSSVGGTLAATAEKDGIATQSWSVDVPGGIRVTGDGEMLRRGLRVVFEHMAQGGAGQPKLSVVGHALSAGGELVVRSSSPPVPLVPVAPEERPSGDPAGTVLGYALLEAIVGAHAGSLQERDGALVMTLPKR